MAFAAERLAIAASTTLKSSSTSAHRRARRSGQWRKSISMRPKGMSMKARLVFAAIGGARAARVARHGVVPKSVVIVLSCRRHARELIIKGIRATRQSRGSHQLVSSIENVQIYRLSAAHLGAAGANGCHNKPRGRKRFKLGAGGRFLSMCNIMKLRLLWRACFRTTARGWRALKAAKK